MAVSKQQKVLEGDRISWNLQFPFETRLRQPVKNANNGQLRALRIWSKIAQIRKNAGDS